MNPDNQPAFANSATETATLAGGCFWCLEAVFEMIKGVRKVESGYAGGRGENPTYREVCTGSTGHAEVVQITFDPTMLSFRDVLIVFFGCHDPTTLNRQGADVGTQYRSAIFYHSEEQRRIAEDVIRELNADTGNQKPIVTEIAPQTTFYPAEDYHRGYFRNHPEQGYCEAVIAPKVSKVRKQFAAILAR